MNPSDKAAAESRGTGTAKVSVCCGNETPRGWIKIKSRRRDEPENPAETHEPFQSKGLAV